jgi:hypothetical protein
MVSDDRQRPRLSIEISEQQNQDLIRLIPWGAKNPLFSAIVDDVIELLKNHGPMIIAMVLTRKLRVSDLDSVKEAIDTLPKKKGKK